jgi:hypothetical protein
MCVDGAAANTAAPALSVYSQEENIPLYIKDNPMIFIIFALSKNKRQLLNN